MLNVVCSTANVVKKCNSTLFVPECVVKSSPFVVKNKLKLLKSIYFRGIIKSQFYARKRQWKILSYEMKPKRITEQ